jgi:integrase/recombinase XerD
MKDGDTPADDLIRKHCHRVLLQAKPLGPVLPSYVQMLLSCGYSEHTIDRYLSALAHFNCWIEGRKIQISAIDEDLVDRFTDRHLPSCRCALNQFRSRVDVRSATHLMIRFLRTKGLIANRPDPLPHIAAELAQFRRYLWNLKGLADGSCKQECRWVRRFLAWLFGHEPIDIARISPKIVDSWIIKLTQTYQHRTLELALTSLRSYFRFRTSRGADMTSLTASLPVLAETGAPLIRSMNEAQLQAFLKSFDLKSAMGSRDFAMARCMSDLGLRAKEVTQLDLDDIDWRTGVVHIRKTKGRRARTLPLPNSTGQAIVRYLKLGRPDRGTRPLFARMTAPFDRALSVGAVAHAMRRALSSCGVGREFSGTHFLRRTLATKMQVHGISLKEVADVLGHKDLQTTTRYVTVDFEQLRQFALPWCGGTP